MICVRLLFPEKTMPKFKIYAKQWMQNKVVKEAENVIYMQGPEHAINAMIRDLHFYAKRHDAAFSIEEVELNSVVVEETEGGKTTP